MYRVMVCDVFIFNIAVPMDMDVRSKAAIFGATFLVVSLVYVPVFRF